MVECGRFHRLHSGLQPLHQRPSRHCCPRRRLCRAAGSLPGLERPLVPLPLRYGLLGPPGHPPPPLSCGGCACGLPHLLIHRILLRLVVRRLANKNGYIVDPIKAVVKFGLQFRGN
jgi:hypothetical protein